MATNSAPITPAAPHRPLHGHGNFQRLLLLPLGRRRGVVVRAVSGGDGGGAAGPSYLDMWKKAVERERRSAELAYRLQASPPPAEAEAGSPLPADVERRTARFEEMLRVPREERDRVQRTQVIDRAAAALAAARAVLKEPPQQNPPPSSPPPPQNPPQSSPPQKPATTTDVTGSGNGSGSRKPAKGLEDPGSLADAASAAPVASQSAEGTITRRMWDCLKITAATSRERSSNFVFCINKRCVLFCLT